MLFCLVKLFFSSFIFFKNLVQASVVALQKECLVELFIYSINNVFLSFEYYRSFDHFIKSKRRGCSTTWCIWPCLFYCFRSLSVRTLQFNSNWGASWVVQVNVQIWAASFSSRVFVTVFIMHVVKQVIDGMQLSKRLVSPYLEAQFFLQHRVVAF